MLIEREKYLDKLIKLKDNGRVKIITGLRRVGKSFLLNQLYYNYLLNNGIKRDHIILISLDQLDNIELLNPIKLYEYLKTLIIDNDKYYIFLDEIQNVFEIVNPVFTEGKIIKANKDTIDKIGFSNIAISLMQIPNVDLYITGSNSKMLSKDIVTEFRDRGDEIYIQPITFSECHVYLSNNIEEAYDIYQMYGGMPYNILLNEEDKQDYLNRLFNITYIKDIVNRNKIKDEDTLIKTTKILSDCVGSLVNSINIKNTFKSEEKKDIDTNKINRYIKNLEDAFLIKKAYRYDIQGRKRIGANYKYYYTDTGINNYLNNFKNRNLGYTMENVIYNELIYRGYLVDVGVSSKFDKDENNKTIRKTYEVDFIARKGSKTYYIQSVYQMPNDKKESQELQGLLNIKDNNKKIMILRNTPTFYDDDGIMYIGIIKFLMDSNSLDL